MAVFDYNLSRLYSVIQNRIRKVNSAYDKLMVYARVYETLAKDNYILGGSPILNTGSEADDTDSPLRERVAEASFEWQQLMVHLIEEGKQSGEFKPDVDSSQIAFSLLSLIEGGLLLARLTKNQSHMQQILIATQQMIQANMVH